MALFRCIATASLLFWASLAAATVSGPAQLQAIRTGIYADHTRIVLDLSRHTAYRVTSLVQPPQLVIELENTQLTASFDQRSLKGTVVAAVNSEIEDEARLRLVFDLSPGVSTQVFDLKPYSGRGDRIVADFYRPVPAANADGVDDTASAPVGAVPVHKLPAKRSAEPRHGASAKPVKHASPFEFSGTWTQEWAVATNDNSTQKFESIVEPRLDIALPDGMSMTAVVRLRADTEDDLGPDVHKPDNYSRVNGPWYNDAHGEFSLRELYLDARWGTGFWRIGKQQVVWGQADGIKVMDMVNPQSYREFIMDDLDDSRIPLWIVNAEMPVGADGTLQLLWIPDTTYHELAEPGTPYVFTSPRLVPVAPIGLPTEIQPADKPDNAFTDSDAGARYSTFLGGWDVTLNYLYQYRNFPVPYQELRVDNGGFTGVVTPTYERNHLLGGTLSNVFGEVTLRSELVYNTDSYYMASDLSRQGIAKSDEVASVIGLDWQLGEHDTLLSGQWFQSHLLDYDGDFLVDQTEHNLSLLYRRTFSNETWQFDALGLYSPNHGDRWIQLSLSHMLRSNLEIWLGGDFFGGDKDGLYGQFSQEDRVLIGLELGL